MRVLKRCLVLFYSVETVLNETKEIMRKKPSPMTLFTFLVVTSLIFLISGPIVAASTDQSLKVGVFSKYGVCQYCVIDVFESLRIDGGIAPQTITAAEIMDGVLDDLDVVIFPGGSGRIETANLGELGQQKIIDFVKIQGGGVVGICAGAYALTETPNYPSLSLSGGEAIDMEHDSRGHGLAKFSLTPAGEKIFPELAGREISYAQYYEGPVLIPAEKSAYKYKELATMLSDVHVVESAPADMTNNRPFIIITEVDKGRTVSVVGHPESTPGMRWMVPRLARLVAGKELIPYGDHVVRPALFDREILFTAEQTRLEKQAKKNLLKTSEDKIKAMEDIVHMAAWLAKRWVPPMVRDKDFAVRLRAAQLIVELERTEAIYDLEVAIEHESKKENKRLLLQQLELLKAILGQ